MRPVGKHGENKSTASWLLPAHSNDCDLGGERLKLREGEWPHILLSCRILGLVCKLLQEEESRETKASTSFIYNWMKLS